MRPIYMLPGYTSKFGVTPAVSSEEMIQSAAREALAAAGVGPDDVGYSSIGNNIDAVLNDTSLLSSFLAKELPNTHYIDHAENACASSSSAVLQAIMALRSGLTDCALAVGYEKQHGSIENPSKEQKQEQNVLVGKALGTCAYPMDRNPGEDMGFTFPYLFAKVMKAAMEQGVTAEQLTTISVKNFNAGGRNPTAHFYGKSTTMEKALESPIFFKGYPLRYSDCCSVTDGYCGAVLATEQFVRTHSVNRPVMEILGFGQGALYHPLSGRDVLRPVSVEHAIEDALSRAGLKREDIDFAQAHDCFTVAELVITRLLTGKDLKAAAEYLAAGATSSTGEFPINPAGGRIGIGHPVGATGLRMLIENYLQHTRQAGENQVGKAETGITVNFGGPYGVSLAFVTRLADV